MKKTLYLLCIMFAVLSCTNDEEPLRLCKSEISIPYCEIFDLKANKDCIWSTDNSWVASVYDGRVYSLHLGTANITAEHDGEKVSCKVTVTPVSNLYQDPILDFGKTATEIKTKETNKLIEDHSSETPDFYIEYGSTDKKIARILYIFKNEKLIISRIDFYKTYVGSQEIFDHLLERCEFIYIYNDGEWFAGGGLYACIRNSSLYFKLYYSNTQENILILNY
ncbi:MAG: hypothetical protein Q8914_05645 [Bacteroidota bacterium]|nr:hypothetical protein [Bacteroidota bacterium]